MSSEEITIFEPNLESGPKEFIILTEYDTLEDYNWVVKEFETDLTYILYPSTFFTPYFRNYEKLIKAHAPDNIGFNSALYALTRNEYGFGFYNTLWRRIYAYLTETESLLNACDNDELYFKLSSQLLQLNTNNNNNKIIVGPALKTSSIDADGLFIRGVRDYVIKMLFINDETDIYDAHFAQYAQFDGKAIPKHEYFLQLWNSYRERENEDEFWQYLAKWRDMIFWDYVTDSNAYLPSPNFTKILKKSHQLYPNDELRHLPLNTSYRSLVHDTLKNLKEMNSNDDDINKVLLIVPSEKYSQHFIKLYGNTSDDDIVYGAPFREFDSFMHPQMKPVVYSLIGFGLGYYAKIQQHKFKHSGIVWKQRVFRVGRWTANCTTTCFLVAYWLATSYFHTISSHSYYNQNVAKQIDHMKKRDSKTRKWTDYLFRKF